MTTAKPRTLRLDWIILSALSLLCIAACLRFSSLENLPGINADEADLGVRIEQMLHGQPYSLRTPAGQFFNPILILSEAALLKYFPPSFYLLRLPTAFFSAMGIVVLAYLYAKFFSDKAVALLLATFLACFPLHMIFSRLGWDSSFLLFWIPIDLLLAMRLLIKPRAHDAVAFLFCSVLSIWTHATAAIFLLALLAALFWVQRRQLSLWLQIRLPQGIKSLAANGTQLFVLGLLGVVIIAAMGWYVLGRALVQVAVLSPHYALRAMSFPGSLAMHLRLTGDILTSYRGLSYVAGLPDSTLLKTIAWIIEGVLLIACLKLSRSRHIIDRFLATLLPFYFLLILLSAGFLQIFLRDHQRYLVPMMTLLPLVLVRAFPRPALLLIISAVMLGQYWTCFQQPALECRYVRNTEPTYWTGLNEPKAQAAKLILHLAPANAQASVVYTDSYWVQQPLQFLLFDHIQVRNQFPKIDQLHPGDFLVGYTIENFTNNLSAQLSAASHQYNAYTITNQSGIQQVIILHIVK